jgi:DNA-binding XRE family transcriptional regulator
MARIEPGGLIRTLSRAPWYEPNYSKIVRASHNDGWIEIAFGDGTVASVEASRLVPSSVSKPDWTRLTSSESELIVPVAGDTLEIPWSAIRALTDPDYEEHLRKEESEQTRRIASRLKQLREARGLSAKTLAQSAGVEPETMGRLERGGCSLNLDVIEKLLVAMDCPWTELSKPETKPRRASRSRLQEPGRDGSTDG